MIYGRPDCESPNSSDYLAQRLWQVTETEGQYTGKAGYVKPQPQLFFRRACGYLCKTRRDLIVSQTV